MTIRAHYDAADGSILGFYDTETHDAVPVPSIEIQPEDRDAHIAGERRYVDVSSSQRAIAIWSRSVTSARAVAIVEWNSAIDSARQDVAGSREPTKLAEYADKAVIASAILAGTATQDMIDEATSEAARLGLADADAAATSWLQMAARLRNARSDINALRDTHAAAINAAADAAAVTSALNDARTALAAVVASYAT